MKPPEPNHLRGILDTTTLREAVAFLSVGAAPDVEVLLCAEHTEDVRTRTSPFDSVNIREAEPGFTCDECWRSAGFLDASTRSTK